MLSHIQEHARRLEFVSKHSITKVDCETSEDLQQHDWEVLWEYCRAYVGANLGGFVAVALASSIVSCDTGWDKHMLAFKMVMISPLIAIFCDRFVVSLSGRFSRQVVHSLCCICTTLLSVSIFCSSALPGQERVLDGESLAFLLSFTPMAVLLSGMVLHLPSEWILKSFVVSCCVCLAGRVNTTSIDHLAAYDEISETSHKVMIVGHWLDEFRFWMYAFVTWYTSTLGKKAPRFGQAGAPANSQLPLKSTASRKGHTAVTPSSTHYLTFFFFAINLVSWNFNRPLESWLFFFIDAMGIGLCVPQIVDCFYVTFAS
jgi:hypothetical protein